LILNPRFKAAAPRNPGLDIMIDSSITRRNNTADQPVSA
jgi:hypothetical protein